MDTSLGDIKVAWTRAIDRIEHASRVCRQTCVPSAAGSRTYHRLLVAPLLHAATYDTKDYRLLPGPATLRLQFLPQGLHQKAITRFSDKPQLLEST